MTKAKSMNKRISIVLSLVLMLLAAAKLSAFATEPVQMPDLREEEGTLTIETKYTDEDNVTNISGTELAIFKVADLTVTNGNAQYTLTEDFKDVDVDFNGMTAEDSIMAANLFYAEVIEKNMEGTKTVSEDGYAPFGKVSHGMYLVIQTGAKGQAEDYEGLDPYLVMAPQPMVEMGTNDWEYDVVSIPKVVFGTYEPPKEPKKEKKKDKPEEPKEEEKKDKPEEPEKDKVKNVYEKETPPTTVKGTNTGDYTNVYIWVAVVLIALSALVITYILRRRSRNKN